MRAGGRVVLNNLSEQIRECLQHAEECAREAAELPNSSPFRQDFLQLEKRWLELAGSIEFGEQLDSFTKNSAKSLMPVHESFHFLQGNSAIVVSIHFPEDTLVSRLPLL